ncbi:MAG: triose-phosphate isomerase, partial [Enterocloster sp.]|nr:triose-phosphate isomerase [Enterocloster sp.]
MARKKIIAGNWKMNMTPSEAVALVNELKPLVVNDEVDVVFCVPAIDIIPAMEAAKGTNIQIGAENMYFEEKGAYTGEISPNMLNDAGVKYVIIGHSERREYFAETDETVNKKVLKAFELADKAHEGQLRASGEPYIMHPLAVADILAHLQIDHITLMAALMHDVVEDTS